MNSTPDNITTLAPNEIFVFGSNLGGRHGAGAALTAKELFGAIQGQGAGLQGRSYGIPTKDKWIVTLSLERIAPHIRNFLDFAHARPDLTFLVTRIGCGFAGYSPVQIKPYFYRATTMPNIILPKDFQ
jgi:hypothetical protein